MSKSVVYFVSTSRLLFLFLFHAISLYLLAPLVTLLCLSPFYSPSSLLFLPWYFLFSLLFCPFCPSPSTVLLLLFFDLSLSAPFPKFYPHHPLPTTLLSSHSLFLCRTGSATRQEEGDDQELPASHTSWHWQRPQLHLCGQQPGSANGQTGHCYPQCPPYVAFFLCQSVKVHRWGSGHSPNCFCVGTQQNHVIILISCPSTHQLEVIISEKQQICCLYEFTATIFCHSPTWAGPSCLYWFGTISGASDFLLKQFRKLIFLNIWKTWRFSCLKGFQWCPWRNKEWLLTR